MNIIIIIMIIFGTRILSESTSWRRREVKPPKDKWTEFECLSYQNRIIVAKQIIRTKLLSHVIVDGLVIKIPLTFIGSLG